MAGKEVIFAHVCQYFWHNALAARVVDYGRPTIERGGEGLQRARSSSPWWGLGVVANSGVTSGVTSEKEKHAALELTWGEV